MGNWRGQRGRRNHNHPEITQQQHGTRSKPPLSNWKPSVPAWEKSFCATVGLVPWGKVVEAKRSMDLYENVVKWNDSAGEEAFNNAKARFWAKINDLPCDISLPDPDTYIEDVDWNAEVDSELVLDLEHDTWPVGETREGEHVVILGTSFLRGQYTHGWGVGWGSGWGDEDAEGINKNVDTEEQAGHCGENTGIPESSWEQNPDGWNDDSWGGVRTNAWDQNHDGWNDDSWGEGKIGSRDHTNSGYRRKNVNRGDRGRRKRAEGQDGWWGKDGYKTWRVQREENVEDCRGRNGRGRSRGSFQHNSNSRFWTERVFRRRWYS